MITAPVSVIIFLKDGTSCNSVKSEYNLSTLPLRSFTYPSSDIVIPAITFPTKELYQKVYYNKPYVLTQIVRYNKIVNSKLKKSKLLKANQILIVEKALLNYIDTMGDENGE